MNNIKLDIEVERKQIMTNRQPRVDATRIGPREMEFQFELLDRFEALQELHDFNTVTETITDMIQKARQG